MKTHLLKLFFACFAKWQHLNQNNTIDINTKGKTTISNMCDEGNKLIFVFKAVQVHTTTHCTVYRQEFLAALSLTPPLILKCPYQARKVSGHLYVCQNIAFLTVSYYFSIEFGAVPTVWYFTAFYFISSFTTIISPKLVCWSSGINRQLSIAVSFVVVNYSNRWCP